MDYFTPLGLTPNTKQQAQLEAYYAFLVAQNKVMNLTAITDEIGVYYKHFYDSLTLSKSLDLTGVKTMLDIGSGAGFPGMVIKIFFPEIKLTIIDSLNKRITFLRQLADHLGLDDIEFIADRAEVFVKNRRNQYDLVTARAVAPLYILDELALPYVKKGGYLVAMKASNFEEELKLAEKGITLLGGQIEKIVETDLPQDLGKRFLIKIKKVKLNNAYPRPFKDIKKKPL